MYTRIFIYTYLNMPYLHSFMYIFGEISLYDKGYKTHIEDTYGEIDYMYREREKWRYLWIHILHKGTYIFLHTS